MVLLYYARGRIISFAGILGPLHEGGTMNERPAISRRDGALWIVFLAINNNFPKEMSRMIFE